MAVEAISAVIFVVHWRLHSRFWKVSFTGSSRSFLSHSSLWLINSFTIPSGECRMRRSLSQQFRGILSSRVNWKVFIHTGEYPFSILLENVVLKPIGECRLSILLENVSFESYWRTSFLTSIGECQFSILLENVISHFYWRMSFFKPTGNCSFAILSEIVSSHFYWRMSAVSRTGKCSFSVLLENVSSQSCQRNARSQSYWRRLLIWFRSFISTYPVIFIVVTISQLIPIKKYNSQIPITSSDSSAPLFNNWFFNLPEKHHSQFSVTALRVLKQGLELHCPG